MEYKSYYNSKIGKIILTSDGKYLTGLWFTTTRFSKLQIVKKESINDDLLVFKITKKWLCEYFDGRNPNPEIIPMKLKGTNFCIMVWEILKEIPYGKTITYGDIANKLKEKMKVANMSSQAVGYAVGHNPISIIIPCHRVVGKNYNLVGYGSGVDKKVNLLKLENVDISKYLMPKV